MYQGHIFVRWKRWDGGWLFRKKQAQSERLLPTQAASQAILIAHYQLLVWNYDEVANSTPETFGLTANENGWVPVMTKLRITPAADAITYAQQNAANVEKHGLNCTDLCSCSDKGKLCKNMQDNDGDDDGGDDDDGDDDDDDDDEDEEEDFYD